MNDSEKIERCQNCNSFISDKDVTNPVPVTSKNLPKCERLPLTEGVCHYCSQTRWGRWTSYILWGLLFAALGTAGIFLALGWIGRFWRMLT